MTWEWYMLVILQRPWVNVSYEYPLFTRTICNLEASEFNQKCPLLCMDVRNIVWSGQWEKTRKLQIIDAGPTNLCQHFTTEAIGIMTKEHKQSALSKARFLKHSKITSSFVVFNLSLTSR